MSSLPLPMTGSCYCKTISYTLNATPIFTNCCHCRDCQALTGSSFALNIMVEASAVQVTSGTQPMEKIHDKAKGDTPLPKSYHCPTCGTMLWATVGQFGDGLKLLRAGTLGESEHIVPDAHFFTRSKHPWIQIPESFRSFETLPGKDDAPLWSGEKEERFNAACGMSRAD